MLDVQQQHLLINSGHRAHAIDALLGHFPRLSVHVVLDGLDLLHDGFLATGKRVVLASEVLLHQHVLVSWVASYTLWLFHQIDERLWQVILDLTLDVVLESEVI